MSVFRHRAGKRISNDASSNRDARGLRAQAMVEFALVLIVAMIVLFVSIQMAFIGQAALALGQMNYQAVRYAAVNPTLGCSAVASYMASNGAPTVASKGVSCPSGDSGCPAGGLTVSSGQGVHACMVCTTSSGTNCTQRAFGDTVQLQLAFDATSVIFLSGNKTSPNFFGIPFPTVLTSTETAMSE